ncbi:MAG: pacearchaeosortase [Candidatus Pacearchaeota archaeon]
MKRFKNQKKIYLNIFIRYFIIIIFSLNSLYLFYIIFTPLTYYSVYSLFNFFYENVSLSVEGTPKINIGDFFIELIPACIAGSAYFLLLILNLTTPGMSIKKRIFSLILSFFIFLFFNIIRIFSLGVLAYNKYSYFPTIHWLFWNFISIFFVIFIWFLEVRLFEIKEIPFYSDISFIFKNSNLYKKKNIITLF